MLVPTLDRVNFNILCASREGVLLVGLPGHVIVYHMIKSQILPIVLIMP
jgi:hypothetical protein